MDKELSHFLEFGTYEEKKNWLTSEEKALIAQERMPLWNRDKLRDYLESNVPDWYFKREFEEILWSGQEEFESRSMEWGIINIRQLIQSREFNYYFIEGAEVMLDEYVMNDKEKRNYSDLIGKKAIITRCYSDLHAFAQGSAYQHELKFEDGTELPKGFDETTFLPIGLIPTYMIKKYEKK